MKDTLPLLSVFCCVRGAISFSPPPTPPVGPEKLPQTGQLKWPVPVLAALGMLLLLAGSILMRRERDA